MARLIDAEEAYKVLTDYYHHKTEIQHDALKEAIERVPTVDPVKHGHWITWFENEDVRQAKCSECGMMFTLGKGRDIHYCGNCGAYMGVEE